MRLEVPAAHLPLFSDPEAQAKRFKLLFGGSGSGKSVTQARYTIAKVRGVPGCNAMAIRKTMAECIQTVFPLLEKTVYQLGVAHEFRILRSPVKLIHIPTENEVAFGGLKDTAEREKFKGVTFRRGNLELVLADEMSRLELGDFFIINDRLRGETGIQKEILGSFNPISIDHWIKSHFDIEIIGEKAVTSRADTYVLWTNVTDNPWQDSEYIAQLDAYKDIDPYHYMVYRLGLWGAIGENNVVIPYPLAWKATQNRVEAEGQFSIGVDPARDGDDEAVIYIRQGGKFLERRVFPKSDGPMLADNVQELVEKWRGPQFDLAVFCQIDITGVGSSCADALYRRGILNFYISEIGFGEPAVDSDKYVNTATEMYYTARDMLPFIELLPDDQKMITQLTRRRRVVDEKTSRWKIEDKKTYKKREKKSPDWADAFVLCLYPPRVTTREPEIYGEDNGFFDDD